MKGQETGEVTLRLIDMKGSVVEVINTHVTQNEGTTVLFKNVQKLAGGVYFLQYIGSAQKRVLRLLKG
jgi:5-hydroxyisourate hydrolase-like protein (transthyretin family)